jgi:hypothetical protein
MGVSAAPRKLPRRQSYRAHAPQQGACAPLKGGPAPRASCANKYETSVPPLAERGQAVCACELFILSAWVVLVIDGHALLEAALGLSRGEPVQADIRRRHLHITFRSRHGCCGYCSAPNQYCTVGGAEAPIKSLGRAPPLVNRKWYYTWNPDLNPVTSRARAVTFALSSI